MFLDASQSGVTPWVWCFFFLIVRRPPRSPLFPHPTFFRPPAPLGVRRNEAPPPRAPRDRREPPPAEPAAPERGDAPVEHHRGPVARAVEIDGLEVARGPA